MLVEVLSFQVVTHLAISSIIKAENCSGKTAKFPAKLVKALTCEPTPFPYSKLFHTLNIYICRISVPLLHCCEDSPSNSERLHGGIIGLKMASEVMSEHQFSKSFWVGACP